MLRLQRALTCSIRSIEFVRPAKARRLAYDKFKEKPCCRCSTQHNQLFLVVQPRRCLFTSSAMRNNLPIPSTAENVSTDIVSEEKKDKKMINLVTAQGEVRLDLEQSYKMIKRMNYDEVMSLVENSHEALDKTHVAVCLKQAFIATRRRLQTEHVTEVQRQCTSDVRLQILCALVAKKAVQFEADMVWDMCRFMIALGLDSPHPALKVCLEVLKHHLSNMSLDQLAHILIKLDSLSPSTQTELIQEATRLTIISNWDVFGESYPISFTPSSSQEGDHNDLIEDMNNPSQMPEQGSDEEMQKDSQAKSGMKYQMTPEMFSFKKKVWQMKVQALHEIGFHALHALLVFLPTENIRPSKVFQKKVLSLVEKHIDENEVKEVFAFRLFLVLPNLDIKAPLRLKEWCVGKIKSNLGRQNISDRVKIIQCLNALKLYSPELLKKIGNWTCNYTSMNEKFSVLKAMYEFGYTHEELMTRFIDELGSIEDLSLEEQMVLLRLIVDYRSTAISEITDKLTSSLLRYDLTSFSNETHIFVETCAYLCALGVKLDDDILDKLSDIQTSSAHTVSNGWLSTDKLLRYIARCSNLPIRPSSTNQDELLHPLHNDVVYLLQNHFSASTYWHHGPTANNGMYVDHLVKVDKSDDITLPEGKSMLAVLEMTSDCFHVNGGQLKGMAYFYAKRLQEDDLTVVLINMAAFKNIAESERPAYIAQKLHNAVKYQDFLMLPVDMTWK